MHVCVYVWRKIPVLNMCWKIITILYLTQSNYFVKLQETSDKAKKTSIVAELSGLDQEQLLPFLLEKLRGAGYEGYLRWLQDQLLEAAYVRLGQCFIIMPSLSGC